MLGRADRELGRLDMFSQYIPNIDLFIRLHVLKEATQSNKIEGTKTNIHDALLAKENVGVEDRDDWDEVHNYIQAQNAAIERLKKLPFSTKLIKKSHKILLSGVRGKHKRPGEFRTSQNWIGGASIKDATFIPPVSETINEYMSDLENFAHNDGLNFPHLLKIALIHYQFETIHPFLDGNGRVGRLMIPIYLVEKGILKKPILYLSDFFERNRMLYYDNLSRVRLNNDLVQWFKFFLVGIIETAESGIQTFDKILKLEKDINRKLLELGIRAKNAKLLVNSLYRNPIFNALKAKEITGLSMASVYKLLDNLEELAIIRNLSGAKRGRLFILDDYVKLFE